MGAYGMLSVKEFVMQASTKDPVPGGGGVSALVGALGTALGSMVGNLTLGKKKYAEFEPEVLQLLEAAGVIQSRLLELVEEDARVFGPLAEAYGLPSKTEEEVAHKKQVMQVALREATLVPLEIARYSLKALWLHDRFAVVGTRIAISDVGVGVALCQAAVKCAGLNVRINTKMIEDPVFKDQVETELAHLEHEAVVEGDRIYQSVVKLLQ